MAADSKDGKDIPLAAAVALGAAVVGLMLYLKNPNGVMGEYLKWNAYFESHGWLVGVHLVAAAINAIGMYSICAKYFDLNQQGKRLEILSKGESTQGERKKNNFDPWPISVGICVGAISYILGRIFFYGQWPVFLYESTKAWVNIAASVNFGLAAMTLGFALPEVSALGRLFRSRPKLPPYPKLPNAIVLGSSGEEMKDDETVPVWETISRHALQGNMLITGSIGSGKTQGTILPYFDQIIESFDPQPAILAIDPKSTFIRKALKIIKGHGQEKRVLHLRLGGKVRFNPIYVPDVLKKGRFLDIAQMVRAAAANFQSDSASKRVSFWEIEAYNLYKNALVYCAAVMGYYTLYDFYDVIVRAGTDDLGADLVQAMSTKPFTEEERFNIECAKRYFEADYQVLDSKIRTSIQATATSYLNQFQEYQAHRVFCPKLEEITLRSMDEIVDAGNILLFDVESPALAKSMGTFVKLHYQQSVLGLMANPDRPQGRGAVIVVDEYQDVVSIGSGGTIGDDDYIAKAREAGGILIAATQSIVSLENAIGNEKAASTLLQNFRTTIAGHSADHATIRFYQELAGQENQQRVSRSISELSQHTSRNLIAGGFEGKDANISESFSTSEHKEFTITGKEFSRLKSFETFSFLYDGVATRYVKLFLKPFYLKKRGEAHVRVLEILREHMKGVAKAAAAAIAVIGPLAHAFPNVCSVVKTSDFDSCMDISVGSCMCGWPVPRPCAKISYYVPQTFIEVMPDAKSSHFGSLPGAATQLARLGGMKLPFGAEADEDTQSFQAHSISVPFASIPFALMPCGGTRIDRFCFDGMSEHLGSSWSTGSGDLLQPSFLAWSASPKACLLKGAATGATGGEVSFSPGTPLCSSSREWMAKFPPSQHSACNGWGTFFPRTGVYTGPSQSIGALMVASRMKSLSSEVFLSTPASTEEKWQMISPQSSSCFREGQNIGVLETIKGVREEKRLMSGELKGFLFVVWAKTSCCRDLAEVPEVYIAREALKATCKGGDL